MANEQFHVCKCSNYGAGVTALVLSHALYRYQAVPALIMSTGLPYRKRKQSYSWHG